MTTANPYSPPSPEGVRPASPGAGASAWLSRLLVAHVLVSVFRVALYGQAILGWDVLPVAGEWVETVSRVTWLASLLLVAPTLAAYSFWISSVNRAVRELTTTPLQFTPGWCVAVSFLPVVNLVAPYRAVEEIRAVVAPRARFAVRLWWGLWMAGLAFGLASRLTGYGAALLWRAPVHDALWAASALALLWVVRALRQGIEHRLASMRTAA